MKKQAFTLAEVLLTLAIIGVVAALTIPAVITKVAQDQYVVGLKKAYNTLKSVEREATQEHGPMENWTWVNAATDFESYFKPHFDILKDCGATTDSGCFPADRTYLSASPWTANFNTASYYRIVISDGVAFLYQPIPSNVAPARKALFLVDVNGLKGPNRAGRDIFEFEVFPSSLGIKPSGSHNNTTGLPLDTATVLSDCSSTGAGAYCAARVLSEGAMNY